jgi:hypothetical protein
LQRVRKASYTVATYRCSLLLLVQSGTKEHYGVEIWG